MERITASTVWSRKSVPPDCLSFTFIWDDEPELEMLVRVTFEERGDKTEMTFRQTGRPSAGSRDGHREGWNESFDGLARVIATM